MLRHNMQLGAWRHYILTDLALFMYIFTFYEFIWYLRQHTRAFECITQAYSITSNVYVSYIIIKPPSTKHAHTNMASAQYSLCCSKSS